MNISERIANGEFLLVVSGESYFTEIVKGPELVNRIMAAVMGEDQSNWDSDEKAHWIAHVFDEDQWAHNPDFGPTIFSQDVGETDHIDLYRIEPRVANLQIS